MKSYLNSHLKPPPRRHQQFISTFEFISTFSLCIVFKRHEEPPCTEHRTCTVNHRSRVHAFHSTFFLDNLFVLSSLAIQTQTLFRQNAHINRCKTRLITFHHPSISNLVYMSVLSDGCLCVCVDFILYKECYE